MDLTRLNGTLLAVKTVWAKLLESEEMKLKLIVATGEGLPIQQQLLSVQGKNHDLEDTLKKAIIQ